MVSIRLFGLIRAQAGQRQLWVGAGAVRDAFKAVLRAAPGITPKQLRQAVVFVNGTPVHGAKRFFIMLNDGDELALLPPVSGG